MTKSALLFLSFGGPEKADDVVPFLENVTRGRGIPRERLEQVGEHYFTLGGRSPINDQNKEIIRNLEAEFSARGVDMPIYFGNRNWEPYAEDALVQATRDGVEHVYVFATSAWGGYSGCGQYQEDIRRALQAVSEAGLSAPVVERLPQFHSHPAFIASFAAAVDAARESLGPAGADAELIFTAHSVPNVADAAAGPHSFGGNLYSQQVLDAARLVQQASSFAGQPGSFAEQGWTGRLAKHEPVGGRGDGPAHTGVSVGVDCGVGTPLDVEATWQSRSGSPHVPWLEPDVCDHIEARAQAGNTRGIVLCPIGFITDHIEVMWDLDTEAKDAAEQAGIPFVRVDTPGLTPEFAAMIADLIDECCAPGNALVRGASGAGGAGEAGASGVGAAGEAGTSGAGAAGEAGASGVGAAGEAGAADTGALAAQSSAARQQGSGAEQQGDATSTAGGTDKPGHSEAETAQKLEASQVTRGTLGVRTEAQQAAADLVAKLGTVPDFGHTLGGRPCAPGCCGSDKTLFD